MDSYYIDLMLSIFFIMIPAVVGWIRFPQINPVFYPFLISIWLNALNVIFGSIIVQFGYYNIFHYNIWFLIDAFLLLWLFKKWNLFESKKSLLFGGGGGQYGGHLNPSESAKTASSVFSSSVAFFEAVMDV